MSGNARFRKSSDPTQSGREAYFATPSNSEPLPIFSRQLYIMADGNLSVVFAGYDDDDVPAPGIGDAITIPVTQGQIFNWAVSYVTESTTAVVLVVC